MAMFALVITSNGRLHNRVDEALDGQMAVQLAVRLADVERQLQRHSGHLVVIVDQSKADHSALHKHTVELASNRTYSEVFIPLNTSNSVHWLVTYQDLLGPDFD